MTTMKERERGKREWEGRESPHIHNRETNTRERGLNARSLVSRIWGVGGRKQPRINYPRGARVVNGREERESRPIILLISTITMIFVVTRRQWARAPHSNAPVDPRLWPWRPYRRTFTLRVTRSPWSTRFSLLKSFQLCRWKKETQKKFLPGNREYA